MAGLASGVAVASSLKVVGGIRTRVEDSVHCFVMGSGEDQDQQRLGLAKLASLGVGGVVVGIGNQIITHFALRTVQFFFAVTALGLGASKQQGTQGLLIVNVVVLVLLGCMAAGPASAQMSAKLKTKRGGGAGESKFVGQEREAEGQLSISTHSLF